MRTQFINRVVLVVCAVMVLSFVSILLTNNLDLFATVEDDDVNIIVSSIRSNEFDYLITNSSSSVTALPIMEIITNNTKALSSKCGDWQTNYESFHKSMISKSKIRLLVAVPTMSGLSDRITGIASAFLVSLVTERVFQIGRHDGLLPLETAFASPFINWTRPQDPHWLMQPLGPHAFIRGGRDYSAAITMSREYLAFNTIEDHRMQFKLTHNNILSAIPRYFKTVMLSINRGKTIVIMDNPYHSQYLQNLGLSKQNVFGCIVNFLLQPKPQIFMPLREEISYMSESSGKVLKIGIQIRIGDESWDANHRRGIAELARYAPYFKCARQIEKFALRGSDSNWTRSLWYILTESLSLRRSIKQSFQSPQRTIVTATVEELVIEHSSKERGVCNPSCSQSPSVSDRGFQTAAAEWWMMGLADYHVITESSGYGRTASMRAMKSQSIYTVPPYDSQQAQRMRVSCGPHDYTPLWKLASDWSGI